MSTTDPYLAKYPFFEAARESLDGFDLQTALTDDDILARATERIVLGVNTGYVEQRSKLDAHPEAFDGDIETEVQSYPVARILVSLIGDYRIINRYAHAEASTALERLEAEIQTDAEQSSGLLSKDTITLDEALDEFDINATPTSLKDEIRRTYSGAFLDTADAEPLHAFAQDVFKIEDPERILPSERISTLDASEIYKRLCTHTPVKLPETDWYRVGLISYVKTAVGLNETPWRLTNRGVYKGNLIVTKPDVLSLFEESVNQRVGKDLPYEVNDTLADSLRTAEPFADCDEVPEFWEDIPSSKAQVIETDSAEAEGVEDNEYDYVELVRAAIDDDHFAYQIDRVEPGLFPPVIDRLLEGVRNGENLKHEARFTLAAFFVNIGMNEDEIVEMLGVGGSFGEEPTRYQVSHIMQGGGSGEPYTPANYGTMEAWGLKWEKDALEAKVTNPLTYYKIKLKEQDGDGDSEPTDSDSPDDSGEDTPTETTEVKPKKLPGSDAEFVGDFADPDAESPDETDD